MPKNRIFHLDINVSLSSRWLHGYCAAKELKYKELRDKINKKLSRYFTYLETSFNLSEFDKVKLSTSVAYWREISAEVNWPSDAHSKVELVLEEKKQVLESGNSFGWVEVRGPNWISKGSVKCRILELIDSVIKGQPISENYNGTTEIELCRCQRNC